MRKRQAADWGCQRVLFKLIDSTARVLPGMSGYAVYTISDDGERITMEMHQQNGYM